VLRFNNITATAETNSDKLNACIDASRQEGKLKIKNARLFTKNWFLQKRSVWWVACDL
jgi:hypothetical protein